MNSIIKEIQERQGWNDVTLLNLLNGFINDNDLNGTVIEYLQYCAEQENEEIEVNIGITNEM